MSGTQITPAQKKEAVATIKDAVHRRLETLKAIGISEQVFNQILLNTLIKTPDLARCTKHSLYEAIYTAIEVGLVPDGKHAAIVALTIKGALTANFWPMVDGRLLLVRRALPSVSIQAHNIHESDQYEDIRGSAPNFFHKVVSGDNRTEATLVASYATAHFADNAIPEIVVMYMEELRPFKKSNKGPWLTHPLEMYKVRALNRLIKRLPISAGLSATLSSFDDETLYDDSIESTATVITEDASVTKNDSPKEPTATSGTKAAPKATAGKKAAPKAETKTPEKSEVDNALFGKSEPVF